jgi:hypothetical protein
MQPELCCEDIDGLIPARLIAGVDHFQDVGVGACGEALDHVGNPCGVKRVKGALCHAVGYQAGQQRPEQILAYCDDPSIQVGVLGAQQRDHRGQVVRRPHPHFDLKTGLQDGIQAVQRISTTAVKSAFDGCELFPRAAIGQCGY